jgi:hypothetical protein
MLDELGLGMDAELPEDTLERVADGGRADRKFVCDRDDAASVSQLVEDFLLAFAEGVRVPEWTLVYEGIALGELN